VIPWSFSLGPKIVDEFETKLRVLAEVIENNLLK